MNISSASSGGSAAELSADYQTRSPSAAAQSSPAAAPAACATDSDGDHDGDRSGGLLNVKA